jgi:serine/threonine protein kinase
MTGKDPAPQFDQMRSAIQTQHPQIASEIDGAISTLQKLKKIASLDALASPPADPGVNAEATIAMTQALEAGAVPVSKGDDELERTQADPNGFHEVPVLAASSSFGRYQIVRLLGRGAMGAVYLAYDTQLHRHVAVKTPFLGESRITIERFYREARAMAQIRSPYLCTVYDVGQIANLHYISMAFIDGQPLTRLMAGGKLKTHSQVIDIVSKVARGLERAHELGIIHRDLKPDNIMIDSHGDPIVMDFGLARRVDEEHQVTMAGVILGTPAFMSPEQVDGDPKKIGPATDIYSLGIVLYSMLTGQLPFRGSLTSLLHQIGTREPPRPSTINGGIGQGSPLEQICLKMIAKSPSNRFATMAEVATALERLTGVRDEPIPPPTALSRFKSWSSGIFSSRARQTRLDKEKNQASPNDSSDSEVATLADS